LRPLSVLSFIDVAGFFYVCLAQLTKEKKKQKKKKKEMNTPRLAHISISIFRRRRRRSVLFCESMPLPHISSSVVIVYLFVCPRQRVQEKHEKKGRDYPFLF
jgi:hypothetical protein